MSKYNLIDIFEQYQIGSGWTNDFDYDGMLNTGLGTSIDTPIEVLKKISDDFEDVNYHRENSHLQYAIDAIEIGDMMEAEGKLSDFHAEIRKTQGDQGMDMSDDLGAYMASKMEENKAVDLAIETSQEKAGIKEGEEEEVEEVSSRVGSRIEGLLNIPMKKKFLDAGMDLIQDLLEDDQFFIPDVIEHLAIELEKYYDGFLDQGDRLAGLEEKDAVNFDMKADEDYDEGLEDIEEALPKFKGVPSMKDIVLALIKDAKATNPEIESYVKSLKQSGDEFDDVDDYVEDFKNYVADKSLQEKQYAPEVVDRIEVIRKALFDTSKFSQMEIEEYVKSVLGEFEKGHFEAYDDYKADDWVEDMNNYISDKALQEHFGRFMKDYQ